MTAGSATDDDKYLYRATISDHLIQLAKQLVQPGIVITGVYSIDRSTFSISYSGFANGEAKGQTINTFGKCHGLLPSLEKIGNRMRPRQAQLFLRVLLPRSQSGGAEVHDP